MNRKRNRHDRNDASSASENASENRSTESDAAAYETRSVEEIRAEEIRTGANREMVEAFVVAFMLALLFRAFIAEAFVIPTGSMAPTLMGAHKDVFCDRCNQNFPVGASHERTTGIQPQVVVAGTCPNCRHLNSFDLTKSENTTFNGDRILVSKFAYTLADPERFDVIVFKFPGNPKQNYIKRLVGLPNEVLTIHEGDIFTKHIDSDEGEKSEIIRKPADKLLAMRHHVYDSSFQSQALIDAKYPSRLQPWVEGATEPPTDTWQIKRSSDDGLSATIKTNDAQRHWLRYFHRFPSESQWIDIDAGQSMEDVDPYSSRLVTDFYPYGSFETVRARSVYRRLPGELPAGTSGFGKMWATGKSIIAGADYELNPSYTPGESPRQFGGRIKDGSGTHWVGDLIMEADVETTAGTKELQLELVESGVGFRCVINLETGDAVMRIVDVEPRLFERSPNPTAATNLRAGQRHQLRFSNCDNELLLWIDDELVEFDSPARFDFDYIRKKDDRGPKHFAKNPMDGAPAGLAVSGGEATVHQLRIDRDKYYIATRNPSSLEDYEGWSTSQIRDVFGKPDEWNDFGGWNSRRSVSFDLKADQFFPMGDNSPHSLDARCWARTKVEPGLPSRFKDQAYKWSDASYVPRDLLVGKALVVFWPHPWNSPVPFTPNLKRMKLIR